MYSLGSRGRIVELIQDKVGVKTDNITEFRGIFGNSTELHVKQWQRINNLTPDGLVGPKTLRAMKIATNVDTDRQGLGSRQPNTFKDPSTGVEFVRYHMKPGEYLNESSRPEYIFLHHTAGWENPYDCIKGWEGDDRGPIGTEFVIGGQSVKGAHISKKFDGDIVQAFPERYWAYHLGKVGSWRMHRHSVGIEVCNFGWIHNGKTWAGTTADELQITSLREPFRGYKTWHRYSNEQLTSLRKLIYFIGNRDSIDVRQGLPQEVKKRGAQAFAFNEDAFSGKVKGIWSHTNVRKDKFDMFPQQELLDMLVTL